MKKLLLFTFLLLCLVTSVFANEKNRNTQETITELRLIAHELDLDNPKAFIAMAYPEIKAFHSSLVKQYGENNLDRSKIKDCSIGELQQREMYGNELVGHPLIEKYPALVEKYSSIINEWISGDDKAKRNIRLELRRSALLLALNYELLNSEHPRESFSSDYEWITFISTVYNFGLNSSRTEVLEYAKTAKNFKGFNAQYHEIAWNYYQNGHDVERCNESVVVDSFECGIVYTMPYITPQGFEIFLEDNVPVGDDDLGIEDIVSFENGADFPVGGNSDANYLVFGDVLFQESGDNPCTEDHVLQNPNQLDCGSFNAVAVIDHDDINVLGNYFVRLYVEDNIEVLRESYPGGPLVAINANGPVVTNNATWYQHGFWVGGSGKEIYFQKDGQPCDQLIEFLPQTGMCFYAEPADDCDGYIVGVEPMNMNCPCTYEWNTGEVTNEIIVDNINIEYWVTITDSDDRCISGSYLPEIEYRNIEIYGNIPNLDCGNGDYSIILETNYWNSQGYEYNWSDGVTTDHGNRYNLLSGIYSVTVTDNEHYCVSDIHIFEIPGALDMTIVTAHANCEIGGSVTTSFENVLPGNSVITTWYHENGSEGSDFTNLEPGNYTATAASGECEVVDSFVIIDECEPCALEPVVHIDSTTCMITINMTICESGEYLNYLINTITQEYVFKIQDVFMQDSVFTWSGMLQPGQYEFNGGYVYIPDGVSPAIETFTIEDCGGCENAISSFAATQAECNSAEVAIKFLCPEGIFNYVVYDSIGALVLVGENIEYTTGNWTTIFEDLPQGEYTFEYDFLQGGSSGLETISINGNNFGDFLYITENETCEAGGSISVYEGGSSAGPFGYTWSNGLAGQGLNTIDALEADTYEVTISDVYGCTEFREFILEYDCMTSTEDPNESLDVKIFPNPAIDQINVVGIDVGENWQFSLINSIGQSMKSGNLGSSEINVSDLPAGVYFLYLDNGERALTEKVTVNRP